MSNVNIACIYCTNKHLSLLCTIRNEESDIPGVSCVLHVHIGWLINFFRCCDGINVFLFFVFFYKKSGSL